MSWLFCMRMSVSMRTPNAFSMRKAMSGERAARSFRNADSADRVTPSARAGIRYREFEWPDDLGLHESARMDRGVHPIVCRFGQFSLHQ